MRHQTKRIIASLIAVTICLLIGGISGTITREAIPGWYTQLKKPFFTPPNQLFAPVWTILYILMGVAAGRIWTYGSYHRWVKTAIYHFVAQLILNSLWSIVFFGLKSPELSLLIIFILLLLIQRTIHWFMIVDKLAAYLLYPYILWVAFASCLNIGIVYYN